MCVQWVAARSLSRIVVVVFVVILSVVVVVRGPDPSSSTLPASLGVDRVLIDHKSVVGEHHFPGDGITRRGSASGGRFRWREHDGKTTVDADHDPEEHDEDDDNDPEEDDEDNDNDSR